MAGLIELPGMKGEIRLSYDMTRGTLDVSAGALAVPQLAQLLIAAAAATVQQWAQADAGIIRPKTETEARNDGEQEKSSDAKNDHDNG